MKVLILYDWYQSLSILSVSRGLTLAEAQVCYKENSEQNV